MRELPMAYTGSGTVHLGNIVTQWPDFQAAVHDAHLACNIAYCTLPFLKDKVSKI